MGGRGARKNSETQRRQCNRGECWTHNCSSVAMQRGWWSERGASVPNVSSAKLSGCPSLCHLSSHHHGLSQGALRFMKKKISCSETMRGNGAFRKPEVLTDAGVKGGWILAIHQLSRPHPAAPPAQVASVTAENITP